MSGGAERFTRFDVTDEEFLAEWQKVAEADGEHRLAQHFRDILARLASLNADRERLDWLEAQSWVALNKTDESDNNGVGLVDSAVALSSVSPDEADNERFPMQLAGTFRAAIDAAMTLRGRESGGVQPLGRAPNL